MSWFTEEEKRILDKQRRLNNIDYKLSDLLSEVKNYIKQEEPNQEQSQLKEILEAT